MSGCPSFVVFGAVGALASGKLIPALARLVAGGLDLRLFGVDLVGDMDSERFRAHCAACAGDAAPALDRIQIRFCALADTGPGAYAAVAAMLAEDPGDRVLYLAIPPSATPPVLRALGEIGLHRGPGWTRLVVEKPFGEDLKSAQELNQLVARYFDESQVFRIDHYLGKEAVQNLLVFRLHNALIESIWSRERVEAVQITAAERVGVEGRGGYYDKVGALRDVVQNHLTQLLALVAMEAPHEFTGDAIRQRKLEALRAVSIPSLEDVVVGQYGPGAFDDGEFAPGYLDCAGIAEDSTTETFVAMRVAVDTPRWQGVPFYLRAGKRLPKQLSQIALRFRAPPHTLFDNLGVSSSHLLGANVLLITIQPDEGFALHFELKIPGTPFRTRSVDMSFKYRNAFGSLPNAYETLLEDVLAGDPSLFVHASEVEESWRIYDPVLKTPRVLVPYAAGTWGPVDADRLALPEERVWHVEYTQFDE